jgi:hypothetical protein
MPNCRVSYSKLDFKDLQDHVGVGEQLSLGRMWYALCAILDMKVVLMYGFFCQDGAKVTQLKV